MYYISFVVDALSSHYFSAELLLFSLESSGHSKDRIIVHCVNRVSSEFTDYLKENGYQYKIIEPYLDGKYCNKIPQLDSFLDLAEDGILLLDIDMFVLEPLNIESGVAFAAKNVDGNNPPINVLRRIFLESGLGVPDETQCDWVKEGGETLDCNFNGGLYYIAHDNVQRVAAKWRQWAEWLYARHELFDTKQQSIHTDQVSMGLCLVDEGVEYTKLIANDNFPTHANKKLRTYDDGVSVKLLHYHRGLTRFGLIENIFEPGTTVYAAINEANRRIAEKGDFRFFSSYKRGLLSRDPAVIDNLDLDDALADMSRKFKEGIRLLFHVGTPKTGTTSLQHFCADNYEALLDQGVLYPRAGMADEGEPKHQWLVLGLRSENVVRLVNTLSAAAAEVREDTHTVILSTEGIFNHWWDYSYRAKGFFNLLTSHFDVEVAVWFREPRSFVDSLYRQYIKNPRVEGVECYGRDMSLSQMMEGEWFLSHLDYLGFACEMEALIGEGNVKCFAYDGDTVSRLCDLLDIDRPSYHGGEHHNAKMSSAAIDILRVVNRLPVSQREKAAIVSLVTRIDELLPELGETSIMTEKNASLIEEMTALTMSGLKERYSVELKRTPGTEVIN